MRLNKSQIHKQAEEAIKYARGIAKDGGTRLKSNKKSPEEFAEISVKMERLHKKLECNRPGGVSDWGPSHFEKMIETIQEAKIGDCQELSLLVIKYFFDKAKENPQSCINAEFFIIENGDHCFAVLNRSEGSDENKPETWGENCVVCDAWSSQIYSAKSLPENLKDYKSNLGQYLDIDEKSLFQTIKAKKEKFQNCNQTEKYDPIKHKLRFAEPISVESLLSILNKKSSLELFLEDISAQIKKCEGAGLERNIIKIKLEYFKDFVEKKSVGATNFEIDSMIELATPEVNKLKFELEKLTQPTKQSAQSQNEQAFFSLSRKQGDQESTKASSSATL